VATPVDDTYEIGVCRPCVVVVHPDDQDWGRTIVTEAQVDVSTLESGHRRTRRRGPPRRAVTFAWTDGIDTTRATSYDDDPDYLKADSGGDPVALVGMSPWQMEGLVPLLDGPDATVVYLPRIEAGPPSGLTHSYYLRRHESIYCRITSPVRLETVQGDENADEVIRIAVVTAEEEV
jgi:hypothetical protein